MMRIYDIALFVFIFNLSLGIMNQMNVSSSYSIQPVENLNLEKITSYRNSATESMSQSSNILSDAVNFITESVELVITGVPMIIGCIWDATIGFKTVLETLLGVPSILAIPLWIIVNLIYFIGIAQLITGRNIKDYQ